MSHIEVKCVKLDADSSPEVMLDEIRKHLGDELPEEALAELANSIVEARRERSAENAKKRGFDMEAEAERIAKLPKERQADALREATIKLGESYGLTREQALKRASEANSEVTDRLGELGLEVPEPFKGNIFANEDKAGVVNAFGDGLKKLGLAGYGVDAAARIGWWYRNQDEYVDLMANVAKLALSNHRPSAKLVIELQQYAANFNQYMYGVCEKAGVDPTVFGFRPKAEHERDAAELDEALQPIRDIAE